MVRSRDVGIAVLGAMVLACGCATRDVLDQDHAELVAAERAFARHAEVADVRTAFLTAFDEDGIWMTPEPMRLREAYASRPAPADPRAVRLEWDPAISGIAASGDFGFTSGPSTLSLRDGSRPPRHGAYFSVWKRDAQQRWRVVIDAGITSPTPIAAVAMLPSPVVLPAPPGKANPGIATVLQDIERAGAWTIDAFLDTLAKDARLYTEGPPRSGAAALREALERSLPVTFEPSGGSDAASGDLAFTYGRWRSPSANGYYVHLWTRDAAGILRIAVALRL